jgi:hypothetical protein
MNDFYPLPLSSNFRLFQYTVQSGDLNQCKVVWPGSFFKKKENIEAKHVFIVQRQNSEFVFCFWAYDKRHPSILRSDSYHVFDKSLAKAKSNRYLFKVHGKSILLPYCPATLHSSWFHLESSFRDDGYILGSFLKHFKYCNAKLKKRKRNMKFKAWKRCDKNNSVLNSYKKFIVNFDPSLYETTLNLNQGIEHLKSDDLRRVKEAALLLHMVFPKMFHKI